MTATTLRAHSIQGILPEDAPRRMALSFLATTGMRIWVLGAPPPVAAAWGALASVISLVDATVRRFLTSLTRDAPIVAALTRFIVIPHLVCYLAGLYIPLFAQKSDLACIGFFAWMAVNEGGVTENPHRTVAWVI